MGKARREAFIGLYPTQGRWSESGRGLTARGPVEGPMASRHASQAVAVCDDRKQKTKIVFTAARQKRL